MEHAPYEAKVRAIKAKLESQIPKSLRLPASTLNNLPLDVTSIPRTCGLLTEAELTITELDATGVLECIAAGKLSAVDAVTAFGKRAAIAHQVTNCLVDFFLEDGIARAKELDAHFAHTGTVVGPLHGLPVSIKDHQLLAGRNASGGFLSSFQIAKEDCQMAKILRSLGAVFYVKTNQPQSIMTLECHSFYGRTVNPYNSNLSSGGSSGGEGALVAMKGSCMGVGSDIGGSIRCPSAHCGIYGMRPTSLTQPMVGYLGYMHGQDGVDPSTGPMCASARDMTTFIQAVIGTKPYLDDPSLIPLSFVPPADIGARPLRVGIMMHDDVVMPHPPTLRALKAAKHKLEAAPGIELVDYVPYKHDEGVRLAHELYFQDGGKRVHEVLDSTGEPILPLTEWVIASDKVKDHDAQGIWKLFYDRNVYRQQYSSHWNASNIDVLLCPTFPGVAARHDTSKYWGYTSIWNILDYPGIVFPSGLHADPALDPIESSYNPVSPSDAYNHTLYDPTIFAGAPISYQLVAKKYNDGILLAAQMVVEGILRDMVPASPIYKL